MSRPYLRMRPSLRRCSCPRRAASESVRKKSNFITSARSSSESGLSKSTRERVGKRMSTLRHRWSLRDDGLLSQRTAKDDSIEGLNRWNRVDKPNGRERQPVVNCCLRSSRLRPE